MLLYGPASRAQGGVEDGSDGTSSRPLRADCGGECAGKLSRVARAGKQQEVVLVVKSLFLEFPAGGLAEGLEGGKRNEVCAANAKGLKLSAVHSALYPLVYSLPRDCRLNALSRLLNTEVVTRLFVGASPTSFAPFVTGTADSEVRKGVTEVHECQAYHTFIVCATSLRPSVFLDSYTDSPYSASSARRISVIWQSAACRRGQSPCWGWYVIAVGWHSRDWPGRATPNRR